MYIDRPMIIVKRDEKKPKVTNDARHDVLRRGAETMWRFIKLFTVCHRVAQPHVHRSKMMYRYVNIPTNTVLILINVLMK